MIALIAAFAAGCLLTFAATRLTGRGGKETADAARNGARARVEEAVTIFGEEMEKLAFDPAGSQVTEAMLGDYQSALDAYDRAKLAPADDEPQIARALDQGRAALVRLSARIDHRPIPIEALEGSLAPAPAVLASTDRFLHGGAAPGSFDVLVDRPEPGRPVIADISFQGDGNFFVRPVTRTAKRVQTGQTLVNFQRTYQGRHLVDPAVTHLKVELTNIQGPCRWSVRFQPLGEAIPFTGEAYGSSPHEVLVHSGGRTDVSVQARTTGTWRFTFRSPKRDSGNDWVYGLRDGSAELTLPAAGWLLIQVPDGGNWSVQTVT